MKSILKSLFKNSIKYYILGDSATKTKASLVKVEFKKKNDSLVYPFNLIARLVRAENITERIWHCRKLSD